ncbi:MAG: cellulase family glycosylhydrolase [Bacteroidales bacterium]|nr:cellulase family glycosylhydrolase [Bacteroidales bacterium]
MKYTNILKMLLCGVMALSLFSCGDDKTDEPAGAFSFVSSNPADGATDVDFTLNSITITYSSSVYNFSRASFSITGGKAKLGNIKLGGTSLNIDVSGIEDGTTYTLNIPAGNVKNEKGVAADAVSITFTTAKRPDTSGVGHGTVPGMELGCKEIWHQVKVGFNLGNTLEACGDWNGCTEEGQETYWGNPMTTKAMVDAIKAAGFNAMRIPTRWYNHSEEALSIKEARTAKDITIKDRWLKRVKEVVDYCIDNDMYVILNSHHDQWYDRIDYDEFDEEVVYHKFEQMWTQIASFFAEYDQHLIFSGTNEVISYSGKDKDGNYIENWSTVTSKQSDYLNKLNQIFVDAVRSTGGNNAVRNLIVQPWACDMDKGIASLVVPEDKVEGRLSVEFHYYQPWDYASTGNSRYTWGSSSDQSEVDTKFDKLKKKWYDAGYGVVMGEYGACYKFKGSAPTEKELEDRRLFHEIVLKKAKEHGFPGFYWDNGGNCLDANGKLKCSGGNNGEVFALFDRHHNMKIVDNAALEGIMAGAATEYIK